MGKYTVSVKRSALKELKKLPKKDSTRIAILLQELSENPRPTGCKKLKSYNNLWRIRSGNFRVIYTIEDKILIVQVLEIIDSKDAY